MQLSDNRVELDRARLALDLALSGRQVAVVSGGDPGIFAMAAAVFEAVEKGDPRWRSLEIETHPGVSAMLAAAARLGAPLGHDFAALSLSDNLKPWRVIERRLKAAAEGDFVWSRFGNPCVEGDRHLHPRRFRIAAPAQAGGHDRRFCARGRPSRPDERVELTSLGAADPSHSDMSTLILIGSSQTRRVERTDGSCWVYTPRSYGAAE